MAVTKRQQVLKYLSWGCKESMFFKSLNQIDCNTTSALNRALYAMVGAWKLFELKVRHFTKLFIAEGLR